MPGADPAAIPLLETRELSKSYRMGEVQVAALCGVSLAFTAGEITVLLGASGSGKSTLLNILGGLDQPTSGSFFFRGRDLSAVSEEELTLYRRRSVGFVFQFYNLISSLTALENVELVSAIVDAPMEASESLRLVGLGDRLHHFPSQLSGGEQQRVAIARAVAKRPELLLCDEPTGALDFRTGQLVLEVIAQVNREIGTTVVLITHNASIGGMADRVVQLRSGEVVGERRNAVRRQPSALEW